MHTNRCARFCLAAALAAFLAGGNPGMTAPVVPPGLPKNAAELADQNALDLLLDDIAGQRAMVVRIQRELVRLTSINPEHGGDGEEARARWIEEWLAAEGMPPPERVDCPDERVSAGVRPNLILRHPAARPDRPTLWILVNLDNFVPGDRKIWSSAPLSLRVDGDLFYGKGVQDNNDAIAATLVLLRSLHRRNAAPPVNLGVLMISGEKALSGVGLHHVLAVRPGLFGAGDHFLLISYGSEEGDLIGIGEKALLWLKFTLRGRQAHSGMSDAGRNALAAGADLIVALRELYSRFPAGDPLFEQPTSTFMPTKPEAPETAVNQTPGEFGFHLDSRLLPQYHPDEVQAAAAEIAGAAVRKHDVDVEIRRTLLSLPTPITPPDTPVVRALARGIEGQLGRKARVHGVGGVSVASDMRRLGHPIAVWQMAPMLANGPDESMSITSNLAEAAVVARMLFAPELSGDGDDPFPSSPRERGAK